MTPARWQLVKNIAADALELPQEERPSYITRACEGDSSLQQEVEQLMAGEQAAGPLDHVFTIRLRDPSSLPADTLLANRFSIVSLLARGGMGEVYRARDRELREDVALKVINSEIAGRPGIVARFRHEVQRARRITHPNVCRIHDLCLHTAGDGSTLQFLTMELIQGPTLAEFMAREGGVPREQALLLLSDLARGLEAAHQAGIAHCDLKPNNVLIDESGSDRPKAVITDFGLARALRADTGPDSTHTSMLIGGAPAYMAPEARFGGSSGVAGDIFAFGIIGYELLTGRHPFERKPVWELGPDYQIIAPQMLASGIPATWNAAILRCLEFEPTRRFASVRELRVAVDAGVSSPSSWSERHIFRRLPSQRSKVLRAIGAALAMMAIVVVGFLAVRPKPPAADFVAVLPFENRTGNPSLAYLSEGVTESLITDLSRIPGLRVSAIGSVMKYKGPKVDVRTAGRALGAARVIGGSFSNREGGLFIDTELIDVATGARIWGTAYSADLSSLSQMLQRFSSEVTDQLRLKLSGPLRDRLKRQYAVGSESYEQYLKARYHLNRRTAADFDQAVQYFQDVISSDPDYAPARAGLAATYARMAVFGPFVSGAEPRHALERARVAAQRAIQLDGTLSEAYNALAMVETNADYDWSAATGNYLRSIELNPNFGEAHENYAWDLAALGRSVEAIREMNLAEKLEPDNTHFQAAHGLVLYMGRRYDESLKVYSKIARTQEGAARVSEVMAMNYWMKSMPAQAQKLLDWMPKELPERLVPFTITAYCRMGELDQAKALHDQYYLHDGRSWWYYLAIAHLNMRRPEDAIKDLEKAYEERWGDVIWVGVDPLLDPLRSNPRFRSLLVRMNLTSKPM